MNSSPSSVYQVPCGTRAWQFTDRVGHFLSEFSVSRILRAEDLITSPAHVALSAAKTVAQPTHQPHELWHTDVTYLQVVHRPRLLSDNGPCHLLQKLATSPDHHGMAHARGAP